MKKFKEKVVNAYYKVGVFLDYHWYIFLQKLGSVFSSVKGKLAVA